MSLLACPKLNSALSNFSWMLLQQSQAILNAALLTSPMLTSSQHCCEVNNAASTRLVDSCTRPKRLHEGVARRRGRHLSVRRNLDQLPLRARMMAGRERLTLHVRAKRGTRPARATLVNTRKRNHISGAELIAYFGHFAFPFRMRPVDTL